MPSPDINKAAKLLQAAGEKGAGGGATSACLAAAEIHFRAAQQSHRSKEKSRVSSCWPRAEGREAGVDIAGGGHRDAVESC